MSLTGAVGLYADVVNRNNAKSDRRNANLAQGIGNIAGTLGDIWKQKQAGDALAKHLNEDLGGDPEETARVLSTRDRDQIDAYGKRLSMNQQMKRALSYMDAGGEPGAAMQSAGPPTPAAAGGQLPPPPINSGGIDMTRFGEGEFTPPGVTPALPPRPRIAMEGVDTTGFMGSGPQQTPEAPPPAPTAPTSPSNPYLDLARRAMAGGNFDAGALQMARGFLPPAPESAKPLSPEDAALKGAQADYYTSQAEKNRLPAPTKTAPRVPFDDQDIPDDIESEYEKRKKLPPGSLKGKTQGQYRALPDAEDPAKGPGVADQPYTKDMAAKVGHPEWEGLPPRIVDQMLSAERAGGGRGMTPMNPAMQRILNLRTKYAAALRMVSEVPQSKRGEAEAAVKRIEDEMEKILQGAEAPPAGGLPAPPPGGNELVLDPFADTLDDVSRAEYEALKTDEEKAEYRRLMGEGE